MVYQRLIVLDKPVGFYYAGPTMITDPWWVEEFDLPDKLCCSQLIAIYLYGKIPVNDFRYSLSRMRGPSEHPEKRGDKGCVFVNRREIWMGRDNVFSLHEQPILDADTMDRILKEYEQYWRMK